MIERLNDIAQHWFAWQWAMLWQTTVLIGLVALLDRLMRKWAWPQLRYALWLLILVKLVLPPSMSSPLSLTSAIPAATQNALDMHIKARDHTSNERFQIASAPRSGAGAVSAMPVSLPAKTVLVEAKPVALSGMSESSPETSVSPVGTLLANAPGLSWQAYCLAIWLLGVAGLCAGLLIRLKGLHAVYSHRATEQAPVWLNELTKKTAQALHCRQVPRVVLSTSVCCPAVFGLFRPVILVPADRLDAMTQQEARHILLHELAHIKRGDLWSHGVYMVLTILYWHNPLIWLIRRHIQNLRELCCDATVARHLREDTDAYRGTLLETARDLLAQPVGPGLGMLGLFENSHWLVTRLHWLQKKTWRYPKTRVVTVVLLIVVMLVCILPMAQATSPEFTIRGRITDAQTGAPIAGATVGDANDYANGECRTQTDSDGRYAYSTWYEEHGINAQAPGYLPQKQILLTKWVGKEKDKVMDFELRATVHTLMEALIDRVQLDFYVCDYLDGEARWWRRDGAVPASDIPVDLKNDLDDATSDLLTLGSQFGVHHTLFAVSLGADELDDVGTALRMARDDGLSWCYSERRARQDLRYFLAHFPKDLEGTSLTLGISAGPWTTVAQTNGSKALETLDTLANQSVKFMQPFKRGNQVQISISHKMPLDYDCRPIVRDTRGVIHTSQETVLGRGHGGRVKQMYTAVFNVHWDDVQSFELQARPYTWLDSQDVALRPCVDAEKNTKPSERSVREDLEKKPGKASKAAMNLYAPEYEWWLKEPDTRITVQEGDPLVIEWAMEQALYEETDFLAVGVLADGVDVSEYHRYHWLAVDIPTTVRRTPYGKAWPASYGVIGEMNKASEVLAPGSYRIVVFGFKEGGGEGGAGDWSLKIKDYLQCVAATGLDVKHKPYGELPVPADPKGAADILKIRDGLTRSFMLGLSEANRASVRKMFAELADHWLFTKRVLPGDTLCERYTVQAGDTLKKISERYKLPPEFLMQINNIKSARLLQVGQELKGVHGPFHIKLRCSENRVDLYLQKTYVKSYDIAPGQSGQEIPTGGWKICAKHIQPRWSDPQTGRAYESTDPDYPLGARWIGLEGVRGHAAGRTGFAIHGNKDRRSPGKVRPSGGIALSNANVIELYNMLGPEFSRVEVLE